jgi:Tfp pilus assembly protein FimT
MTLVELMITLIIIATVLSLALITMRGYIPKQRLLSSVGLMENLFQQAQVEANTRSYWTCVKYVNSKWQIFVDKDNDHAADGSANCDPTKDLPLNAVQLKDGVTQPSCSGKNVTQSCVIWFDTTGAPKNCSNSGCPGAPSTAGICIDQTFQVILSSDKLDPLNKAREVEVVKGGLIQTLKPGERGVDATLFAAAPENGSDTGACE